MSAEVPFPSDSTLRRLKIPLDFALDFAAFALCFAHCSKQSVPMESAAVVAIDGKSIKSTVSCQYDISSLLTCAQDFAQLVQGHWGIENRQHWIKDGSLHEDQAPDRDKRAAANWSIVRTFITVARRWASIRWRRPSVALSIS